jgi:hypothetical protein
MSDIVLTKDTAPATPPSGTITVYPKTDGKLYRKDDTGTEALLTTAADLGSAAFSAIADFDPAGAAAAAQAASDPVGSAASAQAAAIAASDPAGTATSTMSAHTGASDPHSQYLRADGTRVLTADMALATKKFTNVGQASGAGQFVEYAQWQSALSGIVWLLPVQDPGLISDNLTAPPTSPLAEQTYLIGASPTGSWAGKAGRLVYSPDSGTTWVDVLGRAIIVGDRLGIAFEGGTVAGGFTGKANQIATVTTATPGSYAYSFHVPAQYDATWCVSVGSEHAADIYNYNGSLWVETPGPHDLVAGAALLRTGNVLDVLVDNTTVQISGTNKLNVPSGVFDVSGAATTAQSNAQAFSVQRANHTGTQLAATISDLVSAVGASALTGLGAFTNVAILATDTVLAAMAKIQGQIDQIIADANVWTELITTANLTNTSNVTLTNITELAMNCVAGSKYRIEATLLYQATATGRGISLTIGTSNTAAGTIACTVRTPVATDGTAAGWEGAITALGDQVSTIAVQAANTTFVAKIEGVFTCTTSGTIVPQFHSSTNGQTATLVASSVMLIRKF